jgi:hypothetical protein
VPAYYKIDKERKIVMSTASGVVTTADALAHRAKLLKDPDFDPSFSQLLDLMHVATFKVSIDDVRMLAQRSVFSPDSRRAILVKNDFAFGASRVFEMLRDNSGERGIRVFRKLDDALDWVLARNT